MTLRVRNLPKAVVRLDETIRIKTDNYVSSFRFSQMAMDIEVSDSAGPSQVSLRTGAIRAGDQNQNAPIDYLSINPAGSLLLLDGMLLLSPRLLFRATTLSKNGDWSDITETDDPKYPRSGNTATRAGDGNFSSLQFPSLAQSTLQVNSWKPRQDKQFREADKNGPSAQVQTKIQRYHTPIDNVEALLASLVSDFQLGKNQPFGIAFQAESMTEEQVRLVEKNPSGATQQEVFAAPDEAKKTALWLEWGAGNNSLTPPTSPNETVVGNGGAAGAGQAGTRVRLFIDYSGTVKVWIGSPAAGRAFALCGGARQLPLDKGNWGDQGFRMIIYPLAEALYILPAEKIHESIREGNYLRIDLPQMANIDKGSITAFFWGGRGKFAFYPVYHISSGTITVPSNTTKIQNVSDKAQPRLLYLGKYGTGWDDSKEFAARVGSSQNLSGSDNINFPHPDDGKVGNNQGEPFFDYLKPCQIIKTWNVQTSGDRVTISWNIELKSNKGVSSSNLEEDRLRLVYSPIITSFEITVFTNAIDLPLSPNPQIEDIDVQSVNISQNVEQRRATVALWNHPRVPGPPKSNQGAGKFVPPEQRPGSTFAGVKPLTIKVGFGKASDSGGGGSDPSNIDNNDADKDARPGPNYSPSIKATEPVQRFAGFITTYNYSRPNPQQSTVSVSCEDWLYMARTRWVVNLPIFDGWCHLAAMYYLLVECGYDPEKIIIYRDTWRQNATRITLRQVLIDAGSDPDNFAGPCFEGHIDGFDSISNDSGTGLPIEFLHGTLPMHAFVMAQPAFKFEQGQSYFECCKKICQWNHWFLYANQFGEITYQPRDLFGKQLPLPPENVTITQQEQSDRIFNYREVPYEVGRYDEIQRGINNTFDVTDVHNKVITVGVSPQYDSSGFLVNGVAIISVAQQKGWPDDSTLLSSHAFVPWLKPIYVRNYHFNNAAKVQADCIERLRRVAREKNIVNFSAWGNPDIFPFDMLRIEEYVFETGVTPRKFLVINVTDDLQPGGQYYTVIEGEWIQDDDLRTFHPRLIQNRAAQTLSQRI